MAIRITLLAILVIATLSTATISLANAQIITLTNEPSPSTILSLNISFANNTNAMLDREPITESQGNLIVSAVNNVLSNLAEDLDDLELAQEQLEELRELEQEIEEEEESNDNDGGDDNSGSDNGDSDDNGDDEPEPPEEPEPKPPIETIIPGIGSEEGGGDELGLELELEQEILTDGCFGGGYYKDDPNPKCHPINDDGELETEPPKDTAPCTALGCLYNPPNVDPSKFK